jgi:hypothetical protein
MLGSTSSDGPHGGWHGHAVSLRDHAVRCVHGHPKAKGDHATLRRRGVRRGNALLEFILTLPVIIFILGLTITMALAMLARQEAIVDARYHLWSAANGGWTPMKLEGWTPTQAPPDANGGDMPRGSGEELDRLNGDISSAISAASSGGSTDFWDRLWGNLPGRQHTHADKTFKRPGNLWNFIDNHASADHYRDSSPWHFYHIDAWRIARTGPVKPIFDAFENKLPPDVPDFFKPTRDDIIERWFHGYDIIDQEALIGSGGVAPAGGQ